MLEYQGRLQYVWNPPVGLSSTTISTPIFKYDRQTEYTVTITPNGGCPVTDTVLVIMKATIPSGGCVPDLLVPKAWSPNGDGHNDLLYPFTVCVKEIKYFRVFNRWG